MNIKYVSLLSLLCVVGAQCTEKTAPKKIDIAKKVYLDCRNSWEMRLTGCNSQLKAFEQAKQEFLLPHREEMDKGISANNYFNKMIAEEYFWNRANLEVSRDAHYFKTWGHGWIVEAFDGRDHKNDFLNSDKSAEEFSNQVLDNRFCTGESSYVEDGLGNRIMLKAEMQGKHKDHIDSARINIKKMIKEQR